MAQNISSKRIDMLVREHAPDQVSWSSLADAELWIGTQLGELAVFDTAIALHARVQAVVDEVHTDVLTREGQRLFYRSDLSHLVKTPDSILDKMTRGWDPEREVLQFVSGISSRKWKISADFESS